MVCAYCGSDAHVTGYKECPKYCTVCAASGHSRNTNACPNRICSKCHATGHMARQGIFCDTCKRITTRTHAARYVSRQDSAGTRTRVRTVSVPSARLPDITHASVLSAIRAKQIMRRTSVRISNAHIARSTVMMQSDVLKSPRLCAMHAAPARTKRQGQSIARSTNAQRAKANSNRKLITIRIAHWHNAMHATLAGT